MTHPGRLGTSLKETGTALRRHRRDVVVACVLFAAAAVVVFLAAGVLDPRLFEWSTVDVWFEADLARVVENLTDRWSNHDRASVHPLFAFLLYPPVFVLDRIVGLDPYTAIRVVFGLLAGAWLASFYVLLRLIGCRRPDAALVSLIAATSATAVFWFPVPETHTLGSFAILLAMLLVAVAGHRTVPYWIDIAVSALTLGSTVTNWMAGIASTGVRRRPVRAIAVTAMSFLVVLVLWSMAKQVMPSSGFFLGNPPETGHILSPESRGPGAVASSFFLHTVVMPAIAVVDRPGAGQWPIMLTQPAGPGSSGAWGGLSAILWAGLLVMGAVALVTMKTHGRLRLFLAAVIAGQLVLHIAFGNETFLYASNFLPLLVGLAALPLLTRMRRVALTLASLLLVTNTVNTLGQRARADDFLDMYAAMQHDWRQALVLPAAESLRGPDGPKFKVSEPGARPFDQGTYGAGGSFSPGIDQFNVAFWVVDRDGHLVEGSALPGPNVERPVMAGDTVVGMYTETPAYFVSWSAAGPRRWRLMVWVRPGDWVLSMAVRSVGPEIGPIRSLEWNGEDLLINRRWVISAVADTDVTAHLVNEETPGWMTASSTTDRIDVVDGWAAARLEFPGPGRYDFVVEDTQPDAPIDRAVGEITISAISPAPPSEAAGTHSTASGPGASGDRSGPRASSGGN